MHNHCADMHTWIGVILEHFMATARTCRLVPFGYRLDRDYKLISPYRT